MRVIAAIFSPRPRHLRAVRVIAEEGLPPAAGAAAAALGSAVVTSATMATLNSHASVLLAPALWGSW